MRSSDNLIFALLVGIIIVSSIGLGMVFMAGVQLSPHQCYIDGQGYIQVVPDNPEFGR